MLCTDLGAVVCRSDLAVGRGGIQPTLMRTYRRRTRRGCLVLSGRRAQPWACSASFRGVGGGRIVIIRRYPPSKTYQQHALPRGCSGLWRSRAVRAPVGDATAPFRWRTCSTDGGASCWSHDGPSSLVLRCHGWRRSSNHTRSLRSSCAPFGGGPPRAAMPQHDGTASPRRARKTRRVPLRSQAVRPSLH